MEIPNPPNLDGVFGMYEMELAGLRIISICSRYQNWDVRFYPGEFLEKTPGEPMLNGFCHLIECHFLHSHYPPNGAFSVTAEFIRRVTR